MSPVSTLKRARLSTVQDGRTEMTSRLRRKTCTMCPTKIDVFSTEGCRDAVNHASFHIKKQRYGCSLCSFESPFWKITRRHVRHHDEKSAEVVDRRDLTLLNDWLSIAVRCFPRLHNRLLRAFNNMALNYVAGRDVPSLEPFDGIDSACTGFVADPGLDLEADNGPLTSDLKTLKKKTLKTFIIKKEEVKSDVDMEEEDNCAVQIRPEDFANVPMMPAGNVAKRATGRIERAQSPRHPAHYRDGLVQMPDAGLDRRNDAHNAVIVKSRANDALSNISASATSASRTPSPMLGQGDGIVNEEEMASNDQPESHVEEIETLQGEIEKLQQVKNDQASEIRSLKETLNEKEAEIVKLREVASDMCGREMKPFLMLEDCTTKFNKAEAEIQKLNDLLQTKEGEIKQLEDMLANSRAETASFNRQNSDTIFKLHREIGELEGQRNTLYATIGELTVEVKALKARGPTLH